ncbi:MAG: lipopolysaccharide biosynthesis protein, partial [Calditrichaeota bacterium]|nr:lipopolysaccharide biosynthesis protein [Calditrichota bacterium]
MNSKKMKPVIVLYGVQVLNLGIGWAITRLNISSLSVGEFGQFNLFITLINSLFIFFTFGIFEASSRMLALSRSQEESGKILAASLSLAILTYLLFSLVLFILKDFVNDIFKVDIGGLIALFFPLAGIYLLYDFWQKILRGSGKIYRLAWFLFSPRVIYLLILIGLTYLRILNLINTTLANLVSFVIIFLLFLTFEPLNFHGIQKSLKSVLREVKIFGMNMYWAELVHALLFHIDKLFIAFFLDAEELAYYSLAFTITFPLSLFSTSLSTSLYRGFSDSAKIDRKILILNAAWTFVSVAIIVIFGPWIVRTVFSQNYEASIPVLIPLAVAFGISGLSKTYTYFLIVKGEGAVIRNISLILIAVNLILNLILIPVFGIIGSAYARIATFSVDFILI